MKQSRNSNWNYQKSSGTTAARISSEIGQSNQTLFSRALLSSLRSVLPVNLNSTSLPLIINSCVINRVVQPFRAREGERRQDEKNRRFACCKGSVVVNVQIHEIVKYGWSCIVHRFNTNGTLRSQGLSPRATVATIAMKRIRNHRFARWTEARSYQSYWCT